ncbi:hypothetical protein QAD02_020858 [Eretmocerus hayati]|uniref:Uncharacterized protein n=1 Tax=Eretmocerus hayati TaxID=131215 RepID=A0ACC2PTE1_9HYME|nr:hypothetical protein QAD02_020858 [Eretmocerus hayati]
MAPKNIKSPVKTKSRSVMTIADKIKSSRDDPMIAVEQFWKKFLILESITVVDECWRQIKERTLNRSWSKLLPGIVNQGESPAHGSNEVIREIVACARNVGGEGFSNMQESDILEIVENEGEDLSAEDIESLANEAREGEEDSSVDEEMNMTSSAVLKIIEMIQNAIDEAINKDPIMTRCLRFKRACELSSKEYEELHRDIVRRARQTHIDQYFYKK